MGFRSAQERASERQGEGEGEGEGESKGEGGRERKNERDDYIHSHLYIHAYAQTQTQTKAQTDRHTDTDTQTQSERARRDMYWRIILGSCVHFCFLLHFFSRSIAGAIEGWRKVVHSMPPCLRQICGGLILVCGLIRQHSIRIDALYTYRHIGIRHIFYFYRRVGVDIYFIFMR